MTFWLRKAQKSAPIYNNIQILIWSIPCLSHINQIVDSDEEIVDSDEVSDPRCSSLRRRSLSSYFTLTPDENPLPF